MKSNRTVTRDLRRQEFKLLIAKEEEKIKEMKETNRLLAMLYEKFFNNTASICDIWFCWDFLDK